MAPTLQPYRDLSGHSGVTAYRLGRDWIDVEFEDGALYRYTATSAGAQAVEQMKQLAQGGRGLATFIVRHVRQRYAARLR
ncbi:MAG: hypothetical protein ACOZD0_11035 [Pseudomonadota bacterium]